MTCRFTLRDWRATTGLRRFTLAAWKSLSGFGRFTLKAWCDYIRGQQGGEPEPEPDPYTASAVRFDGDAALHIASLTATNNADFSVVGWFKLGASVPVGVERLLFMGAPNDYYSPGLILLAPGNPKPGALSFVNAITGNLIATSWPTTVYDAEWHSLVLSAKLVEGASQSICKIYLDRVDVTEIVANTSPGANPSFLFSTLEFWFGDDGYGDGNVIGDLADWRIMPGTSLLTAGNISVGTLNLFVTADNKPVDPAVATAALGAPCILFSGDSTGFATNQGTGGAFTLTGTLTNASTSPSD